ncbi:cohesin domain-containing protein [Clostridium sp. MB05]
MRKIIMILLSYFMIMTPVKAFAENNVSVEAKVIGEIKKGFNIEILIDVKNVDNLYAASIDFTYDTKQLEVESIKSTEYISKNIDNIMELGGEVDKNGDTASYSFTFLGDVDGLMGSGTLVKINANVLNNDKVSITKENMKIKLVQKADGTVKNYDYNFIGYNGGNDSSSSSSNGYNTGSNNGGSNSSSNDESDNKSSNNKSSNDKNNLESTEENKDNKDRNTSNDEGNSGSKANGIKGSNTSKDKDGSSETSKSNFSMIFYILIPVVLVAGAGYYYYKFRRNKNKDN